MDIATTIAQIIGGVQLLKKLGVPTKYLNIITAIISFSVAYAMTQDIVDTLSQGLVIATASVGTYKIAEVTGDRITKTPVKRVTLEERYTPDLAEQIEQGISALNNPE